jgi:hypothetical protein
LQCPKLARRFRDRTELNHNRFEGRLLDSFAVYGID